ncbi:MAG: zinc-binding dehydrogenase, partial [Flavobacteriales bacterium]
AGVADKLMKRLALQNKQFTIVRGGAEFTQNGDDLTMDPLSEKQAAQAIEQASDQGDFEGIIFCWAMDLPANEALSAAAIEEAEAKGSITLMNIMKKLNSSHYEENPKIWVLFSGAQSVAGTPAQPALAQEGLRGVAKVCLNEFPNYLTTLVDFSMPVEDAELDAFIEEIYAPDRVDELAFRGGKRYVNILERLSTDNIAQRSMTKVPAEGFPYTASITEYGVLDNIVLRKTERRKPASDEVEVQVKASALNFRDIMIAMGLLSDAAVEGGLFGRTFGLECAGVVSAVGSDVTGVKTGDEVMATAPACLGGFAYPKACHVVQKPSHINWQEAASLPVVYTTTYFSLIHHCRLTKGESILIHAAAGGVGIAAINIANAIGAEIYATVSTEEKRKYIEKLGVKPGNIMNSRTLSFADELMEKTNGRGVDVVLNSLSGEAIFKSIRCLAPYGRFVEIGKTDIYRNSKLGLQPFGNNLTYFGVDVDRLFKQKERFGGELFQQSIDHFVENKFEPHPVTVFPVSKLADAFQYMGGARHIGKIIISMEGEVSVSPPSDIRFKEDATYLITGGASGFGLSVAEWMTTKGCRHLVLL